MQEDPNIRTKEERYGGAGHAGEDPYAGERAGKHKDIPADPDVTVPDADLDDLVERPDPAPDRDPDEE